MINALHLTVAGALYNHTAAKILFIRLFRNTRHLHDHSALGWIAWIGLVVFMNGAAFVLAIGVPIFAYLIGIAAALFGKNTAMRHRFHEEKAWLTWR